MLTYADVCCCLQNHHYVLKQLVQSGPLELHRPRQLKGITSLAHEAQEQALLLFRGESGASMRQRLVERAGHLPPGAPARDTLKFIASKVNRVVDSLYSSSAGQQKKSELGAATERSVASNMGVAVMLNLHTGGGDEAVQVC